VSGQYNTGSGTASTVNGQYNTASGDNASIPGGQRAIASHPGEMAYANGRFAVDGDAQTSIYILRGTSTTDLYTELFLDGASARLTIPSNRVLFFDIRIVGVNTGNGNVGVYRQTGYVKNIGGTTTAIVTPYDGVEVEDALAWAVALAADDTNDAFKILVLGASGQTIRWVATVLTVEVSY
jgi:hypothetical protein